MSEELKVNANYSASSFLAAAKNKIEESSFFWGDLMREATRLSRICFISLISPRKKLAVSLSLRQRLFLISLHSNDCFLSFGTIIFGRNRRRKNLPARWRSRQESERSGYRVIDRAKGVILPLDLGEYKCDYHPKDHPILTPIAKPPHGPPLYPIEKLVCVTFP